MTEAARYLRRLAALGCGLALYCLLMTWVSRGGQGILLSIHGLAATSLGVAIAVRRFADRPTRWTTLSASLILVAWGLAELGWASSFFLSHRSHRALRVVLATESGYFIAFLLCVVCMLSAVEGRLRSFFARSVVLIPLLLTSPIAFRLILDPFLHHRDAGLTAFNLGETTAIAVSYVALNLALLVLLSTRSLDWSIFAAGVLCLVFGDWSVRLDKITGLPIDIGLGSFFILFGLYSAAVPFVRRVPIGRIQPFQATSILNSYRAGLLAVALSMVLVFALYQSTGGRTLRILCLGSGAVTFVAVFLSQMLVERVQWVSTEIGRLLRSELARDRADAASPESELPVELHEIYRLAFSATVREQKLREEQRAIEQVRQVQEQVAHDIRSPLAAIDAALSSQGQAPAAEHRRALEQAAARIRDIADDLMAPRPATADAALGSATAGPCLLAPLVEEVVAEKRLRLAAQSQVTLAARLDASVQAAQISGSPPQLKRALSNLIDNAIDAIAGDGQVKVVARVESELGILTITDTGRGIPPEVQAQLGVRGFTHGKNTGSGLGLHQARAAVEQAGGTLTLQSAVAQGTTVEIRLPLVSVVGPAVSVLVIDDDEMIDWSWRKRQQRLGLAQLHWFRSMEACEAASIDYAGIDLAFLDLHVHGTAWPIERTIQHLKSRGVRRVFIATGAPEASTDPACQQADGITADKVPSDLAPYLSPSK